MQDYRFNRNLIESSISFVANDREVYATGRNGKKYLMYYKTIMYYNLYCKMPVALSS